MHHAICALTVAPAALISSGLLQARADPDAFCVQISSAGLDLSSHRGRTEMTSRIMGAGRRMCARPTFGAYDQAEEVDCLSYFDAAARNAFSKVTVTARQSAECRAVSGSDHSTIIVFVPQRRRSIR
jgi:UrcA family protein